MTTPEQPVFPPDLPGANTGIPVGYEALGWPVVAVILPVQPETQGNEASSHPEGAFGRMLALGTSALGALRRASKLMFGSPYSSSAYGGGKDGKISYHRPPYNPPRRIR